MAIKFRPGKRHLVFTSEKHLTRAVTKACARENLTFAIVGAEDVEDLKNQTEAFEDGDVKVLILHRGLLHGWHVRLTDEQVDVHFVGEFRPEEIVQGMGRLSSPNLGQ